jgi:muramoyltetrapeptide carboxypeptidase
MLERHKPEPLKRGGTVALVAPASTPSPEQVSGAVRYLENAGFRVLVANSSSAQHYYTAGPAADRAEELQTLIENPAVDALFCVRGGFGTVELLPLLDFQLFSEYPKLLAGFSDITILQSALFTKAGLPTLSGALPGVDFSVAPVDEFTESCFNEIVTSGKVDRHLPPASNSSEKDVHFEGVCIPGTLSLFSKLAGTPYMPDSRGAVLVLEDVDEPMHKIEGYLWHLAHTGWLRNATGIVFGTFSPPEKESYPSVPPLDAVLNHVMRSVRTPWISGIPYGHIKTKLTLPFGTGISVSSGPSGIHIRSTEPLFAV